MGQSAVLPAKPIRIDNRQCDVRPTQRISVFATPLGWFGLVGQEQCVWRLTIGHASFDEVRTSILRQRPARYGQEDLVEEDWFPELRSRLQAYASGRKTDFSDCDVEIADVTSFQNRVLAATRRIAYGQTATYGELAKSIGCADAARAVGNVMAANRVPIVIPCHRVVAAGGKWGGFSAPQGVDLKRRMLLMEKETCGVSE
jgi:methylated-DNA-[protein]-cysteine S-methyltransferase